MPWSSSRTTAQPGSMSCSSPSVHQVAEERSRLRRPSRGGGSPRTARRRPRRARFPSRSWSVHPCCRRLPDRSCRSSIVACQDAGNPKPGTSRRGLRGLPAIDLRAGRVDGRLAEGDFARETCYGPIRSKSPGALRGPGRGGFISSISTAPETAPGRQTEVVAASSRRWGQGGVPGGRRVAG